MPDNRPIGVFDSGLGGLTVVKELKKLLKNESIVYFGDTGRVPYGTRSAETIIRYAREDEAFLLKQGVKMIIAACGTVSSVAGCTANDLPVPYFEMVTPAALGAVRETANKKIGVIGTPATVKSGAHARKILEQLPDAEIAAVGCPLFVPLVEEGWISPTDSVTVQTAERYLKPLKNANVDTLIMGCTHYPVLEPIIKNYMGPNVKLINMGTYTAMAVEQFLNEHDMAAVAAPEYHYYVSDRAESFSDIAKTLLNEDISDLVKQITV